METGIVKKIDKLGRIVLPIEMRDALDWDTETQISVIRQGNYLLLKVFPDRCCICGGEESITPIRDTYICRKCMDEIICGY